MTNQWSRNVQKQFEAALVWFPEDYPNRWETIAGLIPGATKEMVYQRYQELLDDVVEIESGRVPLPDYPEDSFPSSSSSSFAACEPPKHSGPMRKRGPSFWTLEEHALFLLGVQKYGKGDWKNVSENAVVTRNATQVASHAQKFYIHQSQRETKVMSKRASIHDVTLEDLSLEYLNQLLSSRPHLMIPYHSPLMHQATSSSIHNELPLHHHISPPINQLGTQTLSTHQSHQAPTSPIYYDLPRHHYDQELAHQVPQIEPVWVPPMDYYLTDSRPPPSSNPIRKRAPSSWTLEEHTLFLLGVHKYGKGDWKNVSENAVVTKNATQVASHAQKFYNRQSQTDTKVNRRASIHDFTLEDLSLEYLNQILSSRPHLMPHSHLLMNQLETQVPWGLQSHQAAPSPIDYVLPLNQPLAL